MKNFASLFMSLQKHGIFRVLRKYFWLSTLAVAIASGMLLTSHFALAAGGKNDNGAVTLLKTIPISGTTANTTNGKLYSFDISFVDQSTQTYYLADRSNVAVDVVDAKTAAFITQVSVSPPFAGVVPTAICTAAGGSNCSGPNGVVAASPWLFVTDGGSSVVNIDLRTGTIAPGGDVVTAANDPNRADELAYAPELGLLLVINNADAVPFGTFISVNTTTGALTVGQRITFTDATNGAEQPVWNPDDGRFYLSIPSISGTTTTPGPTGAVYRIDPIDCSGRARGRRRSGYRWDREIEPAVVGVPHGLFGAIRGVREGDPLPNSEGASRRIDADEGPKRHRVGVVDHQEQPQLRGVRQFIRPVGIIGSGDDVAARRNRTSPQVNIDHAAAPIGHEEPRRG